MLLSSVFAIVSGVNSYRGIRTYIKAHRQSLNKAFQDQVKETAGAYRDPLYFAGAEPGRGRKGLPRTRRELKSRPADARTRVIAFDGKTLKDSFDNFNDADPRLPQLYCNPQSAGRQPDPPRLLGSIAPTPQAGGVSGP